MTRAVAGGGREPDDAPFRASGDARFGARPLSPGRWRFRLWAPGLANVRLLIQHDEPLAMHPQPGGWFEIECSCAAGTPYRFLGPDGEALSDPASRFQRGGVEGWSVTVDHASWRWSVPWKGRPWREMVFYELHAGLLGGFAGVEKALPALAELGVTAIQIMPVAAFPGARNWGYDGVLPFAPDGSYGRPEDLKRLVDSAHALGLCVFLDVVYNHFGPHGASIRHCAPQGFREDIETPWGAAIDFRCPEMRDFFVENALSWLNDYRMDGLRLDAVQAIHSEDFLPELSARVRAGVDPERHVHLVLENDENEAHLLERAFEAQWNDDVHHVLHVLLTGETRAYYSSYREDTAERLARALREGFVYQGDVPSHRSLPRGSPSAHLPPTRFVNFLQNHDQIGNRAFGDRLTTLSPREALEVAVALLLLGPAIPMIFMGEEIGATAPFLYFTAHHEPLAEAVRAGRAREFAGFMASPEAQGRGPLPDPNDPETFERSRPRPGEDAARWTALYRRLLSLRHARIVPLLDDARAEAAHALSPEAVSARWRLAGGARLTLLANFGAVPVSIDPPAGEWLFSLGEGGAEALDAGILPARGFGACLEEPA